MYAHMYVHTLTHTHTHTHTHSPSTNPQSIPERDVPRIHASEMVTSKKHLETLEADNKQMKNEVAQLREQLSKYVDSDSELENRAMKQQVESLKMQLEQQAADAVSGRSNWCDCQTLIFSRSSVLGYCPSVVGGNSLAHQLFLGLLCNGTPLLHNRTAGT